MKVALLVLLTLWLSYGHGQTFLPKLIHFQGNQITLSDSTTKVMALWQLQGYLKSDSAIVISMSHFHAQYDQLSKMTRQIIEQDTTIRALQMVNTKSSQEIANRDLIITEKDLQIQDKQGIIDGADAKLKNVKKMWLRRTLYVGGGGLIGGAIIGILATR